MLTKDWGIDLTGRKMCYKPWPVYKDGNYKAPDEKEIDEIYGISGEAVKETLLYFEDCGGDTGQLIYILNEHAFSDEYQIIRKDLLNSDRWYTNEYYFYFIMFTKKVIGRYDFHYGENSDELLSVYHKIYEKGFLESEPWGLTGEQKIIHDQGLSNIIGPLLYLENNIGLASNDFISFLNSSINEKYQIDRSFFNNQTYWVSAEFSDLCYELLKIISNNEKFLNEAARYATLNSLRMVKIVANLPDRLLMNALQKATEKSNEIFIYNFINIKPAAFEVSATVRKTFNLRQLSLYRRASLLNRVNVNIAGFSGLLSQLHRLNRVPDKIDSEIDSQSFGFRIKISWFLYKKYNYKQYLLSSIIAVLLNILIYFLFQIVFVFLIINTVFNAVIFITIFKLNFSKKLIETKLFELHTSSMEQMDALEKTSASLLEERNLLELKVTERTAELAAANEKLRELDKAKTDFFANISHELRTPLTLILAPVEEALSGRELNRNTLDMIRRNALDLLSLINGLLQMSRITAGKYKLNIAETDLSEMVKQFCGGMESAAKIKGLELVCNVEESVTIYADHERLSNIISNFFSNSFKFTKPGGKIEVTVRSDNTSAILEFGDTGCGIPCDKLDTIFDRFTQADTGSTRKYEGTGIGLSIVKELVELHGGEVSVESRCGEEDAENHGTLFTVKLPLDKEHFENRDDVEFISTGEKTPVIIPHVRGIELPQTTEGRPVEALSETAPAILVVEDNRDLRTLLVNMLSGIYLVYEASNGVEAVKILESTEEIDLVLSDIMMPGMDGYELLKWIRCHEKLEGLPVLFLTARAEGFMKVEGLDLGATDYVTKPFNSDELLLRIRNQIELQKLRNSAIRNYNRLLAKMKSVNSRQLSDEGAARIKAVCEFIRENCAQEIRRDDLADAAGMNPDTFSRLFNLHTGKTLGDYINGIRIDEAKQRLAETYDTVTRISIDTGFDSIRTFNRVFKKITGVTPLEYRGVDYTERIRN